MKFSAGGIAAVLFLAGCTSEPEEANDPTAVERSGNLTLAAHIDNNSFDTANLDMGPWIQYWQPIYDTLIHQEPNASLSPNLATEWSYNEDNTILTLQLREDVTFTDGAPFNAEAVVANAEHFKNGAGVLTFQLAAVDEVIAVDEFMVEYHLSAPNPALPTYLSVSAGAMASPAAIAAGTLEEEPVGSGPYILDLERTQRGTSYVYVENEDYWNPPAYPFAEIVINPMTENTPRINALKTGQVNAAFLTQPTHGEAEASGLNVLTGPVNWIGLSITDRDGGIVPALEDVRVRRALNMAIDKEVILQAIFDGLGTPTSQIFSVDSDAYVPELDGYYEYDPVAARELLEEAGYGDGFTVTMPATAPFPAIDPIVDQQLRAIGVTVVRDNIARNQFPAAVLSGDYALFTRPHGSRTAWDDVLKFVMHDGSENPNGSEFPELTELIEAAQFASDDDRVEAFQALNQWLVENAWSSPWLRIDNVYATTTDVTTEMQSGNAVPFISSFAKAN